VPTYLGLNGVQRMVSRRRQENTSRAKHAMPSPLYSATHKLQLLKIKSLFIIYTLWFSASWSQQGTRSGSPGCRSKLPWSCTSASAGPGRKSLKRVGCGVMSASQGQIFAALNGFHWTFMNILTISIFKSQYLHILPPTYRPLLWFSVVYWMCS